MTGKMKSDTQRLLNPPGLVHLPGTLGPLSKSSQGLTLLTTDDGVWRTTSSPEGPATLHIRHRGSQIEVQGWGPGAQWATDRADDLLGFADTSLDEAPTHPVLKERWKTTRGHRMGRTHRLVEPTLRFVLGQRVTSKGAQRSWRHLVRELGQPAPGPRDLLLVPSPSDVRALPLYAMHPMGIEESRGRILHEVSRRAGRLEGLLQHPPEEVFRRMQAVRGIGPWTAAKSVSVALGWTDAVQVGDYALAHTITWNLAGEPRGTDERMLELLEPYRPHRQRVIRLLKHKSLKAPQYGPKAHITDIREI